MAKKKKIKIEEVGELKHSPFSELGALGDFKVRDGPSKPVATTEIEKTKNSLLIREEKRKNGKWVTCVYHLGDSAKTELTDLKKKLGAGGRLAEKEVLEIQGRHKDKIVSHFKSKDFRVRMN